MCDVPVVEAGGDRVAALISAAAQAKTAGTLRIALLEGARKARGARCLPRVRGARKPEPTTPLSSTTTGTGIPEGFRPASPGRADPEARKCGSRWTKNFG